MYKRVEQNRGKTLLICPTGGMVMRLGTHYCSQTKIYSIFWGDMCRFPLLLAAVAPDLHQQQVSAWDTEHLEGGKDMHESMAGYNFLLGHNMRLKGEVAVGSNCFNKVFIDVCSSYHFVSNNRPSIIGCKSIHTDREIPVQL